MERNEGNEDVQGGQAGANEFSGAGSEGATQQEGSADGERAGSFDFAGAGNAEQSQSLSDRARNAFGTAGGRLADVGSTVRERAGTAKEKLADALDTGAERLRQRAQGGTLAGATTDGSTEITGDGRVSQISDRLAGGMERSADWLRDADLDNLKAGIERQVKEHPGRTLLLAAGLGYLIGRAFRGDK
jgi:hypothetical protein